MANNVAITAGSGTTVCTTDITSFASYSSTGQVPAGLLYCSANTSTQPAPVTNANPLPVGIQGTAAVTQSGTWNVGTVTAVTGITNPVAAAQSGSWTVTANAGTGTLATSNASIGSTGSSVPTSATHIGAKLSTALQGLTCTQTSPGLYALHCDVRTFGGNIGQNIASLSMPVAIASDQSAIPASLNSAAINNGTTALTPKFAAIAASSSGNNTVVAAVTGKKIRVLGYRFSANGTVAAKWRSSTAGDISGLSYLVQYASAGASFSPVGHFETTAGEGLVLNLDGAVAVGGHVSYVEV